MCTCGSQVFWKADEPQSDEWLLIARKNLPDDPVELLGVATQVAFCWSCGRLWIANRNSNELIEYVPTDPSTRAPRRPGD